MISLWTDHPEREKLVCGPHEALATGRQLLTGSRDCDVCAILPTLVEKATHAFFATVAYEVEADTGDIDPGTLVAFEAVATLAIEAWLRANTR